MTRNRASYSLALTCTLMLCTATPGLAQNEQRFLCRRGTRGGTLVRSDHGGRRQRPPQHL